MAQPPKRLPYIKRVTARGKVYEYFDTGLRVDGKPVLRRLPTRSDRSFGQVYAGMVAARHARKSTRVIPTIAGLSREYQRSAAFTRRAPSTQSTYAIYLRAIETHLGMAPVNAVQRRDVTLFLSTMKDRPGAANMALLVLRNLFKLALSQEMTAADPTAGIEEMEREEREHEPWPAPLIEAALSDPTVRLPVALLYFTAQRIGDVCKMRWSDIRDGRVYVRQQKTRKELDIRLHGELAAILADTPRTGMTILHDAAGKPLRTAALRLRLQAWAETHGDKVVPHGLRKNAVIALLEAGCSIAETSAISGQSLALVEHYAKRRNNRTLGDAAILRWQGTDRENRKQGKTT